ncbi:MAG: hypothetical protein ACE5JS_16370 [Nitrospinota bacterium]
MAPGRTGHLGGDLLACGAKALARDHFRVLPVGFLWRPRAPRGITWEVTVQSGVLHGEVAVPQTSFAKIRRLIAGLRRLPHPT